MKNKKYHTVGYNSKFQQKHSFSEAKSIALT